LKATAVISLWVNGSLALTDVTHPKMVTHLTHDPMTHLHLCSDPLLFSKVLAPLLNRAALKL